MERKHTEDRSPSHQPLTHLITIHPQKYSAALRIVLHIFVYSLHTYTYCEFQNAIVIPLSAVAPSFSGFLQLTLSCL